MQYEILHIYYSTYQQIKNTKRGKRSSAYLLKVMPPAVFREFCSSKTSMDGKRVLKIP